MITFGFSQHQISAIARIAVRLGTRYVKHTGTVGSGETVRCWSGGSQLSPGWGSTEMISDSRSDANRKVPIQGLDENQLPTAKT